jgi:hypothetical protein
MRRQTASQALSAHARKTYSKQLKIVYPLRLGTTLLFMKPYLLIPDWDLARN